MNAELQVRLGQRGAVLRASGEAPESWSVGQASGKGYECLVVCEFHPTIVRLGVR